MNFNDLINALYQNCIIDYRTYSNLLHNPDSYKSSNYDEIQEREKVRFKLEIAKPIPEIDYRILTIILKQIFKLGNAEGLEVMETTLLTGEIMDKSEIKNFRIQKYIEKIDNDKGEKDENL